MNEKMLAVGQFFHNIGYTDSQLNDMIEALEMVAAFLLGYGGCELIRSHFVRELERLNNIRNYRENSQC